MKNLVGLLCLLAFPLVGCATVGPAVGGPLAGIAIPASHDDATVASYERAVEAADRAPGDLTPALILAEQARMLLHTGVAKRRKIDVESVVRRVEAALARVTPGTSEDRARTLVAAGYVQLAAGNIEVAIREVSEGFELAPTPGFAVAVFEAHEARGSVPQEIALDVCQRARKHVSTPKARYAVIGACLRRLDESSLPFEDREGDLAFHDAEARRLEAEADHRRRMQQRESERRRAQLNSLR